MTELQGQRVVLRPLRAGDRPLVARWLSDRELRRYVTRGRAAPPKASDSEEFLILLGSQPIGVCGLFGIEEKGAEVGIVLGEKDAWGHGYGPEALGVLLRYAHEELGLTELSLYVHATNARAVRAYTKVGFSVERRLVLGRWLLGRGQEVLVMHWRAPGGGKP